MNIAALVAWILTAAGGFVMLAKWISHGGVRSPGTSRFPPGLIFSHFGLAAAGLVLWIIYLINDQDILAWVAFALLVIVALLGFTMLVRWLPGYRAHATVAAGDGDAGRPAPRRPSDPPSSTSPWPWSAPTACWPSPPSCWCCSPRSGWAAAEVGTPRRTCTAGLPAASSTARLQRRRGPGHPRALLVGIVTAGGLGAIRGALPRARELEALGYLQITLAADEKMPWTRFGVTA